MKLWDTQHITPCSAWWLLSNHFVGRGSGARTVGRQLAATRSTGIQNTGISARCSNGLCKCPSLHFDLESQIYLSLPGEDSRRKRLGPKHLFGVQNTSDWATACWELVLERKLLSGKGAHLILLTNPMKQVLVSSFTQIETAKRDPIPCHRAQGKKELTQAEQSGFKSCIFTYCVMLPLKGERSRTLFLLILSLVGDLVAHTDWSYLLLNFI